MASPCESRLSINLYGLTLKNISETIRFTAYIFSKTVNQTPGFQTGPRRQPWGSCFYRLKMGITLKIFLSETMKPTTHVFSMYM